MLTDICDTESISPYLLANVYIDNKSPSLLTHVILTVYRMLTGICVTYRHADICNNDSISSWLLTYLILTVYRHAY